MLILIGCNNSTDILSGRTFDLAYPPSPVSETNGEDAYNTFMTLIFDDGIITKKDGNEVQGVYALKEETITITFKHREELKVEFDDFVKSDKKFSSYSAVVSNSLFDNADGDLNHLMDLSTDLSMQFPIEFIEE